MLLSPPVAPTLTAFANGVFELCSNLTSVVIPICVETIGSMAFYRCTNLKTVNIPENSQLLSIGPSAFANCDSLKSIKYRGTQTQWNAISKEVYWNSNTGRYTITYNYTGN